MVNTIFEALERAGWRLVNPGVTATWYMPFDGDGALDMEVLDGASRDDLLRLFQEQIASGATFGTPMYWNGNRSF